VLLALKIWNLIKEDVPASACTPCHPESRRNLIVPGMDSIYERISGKQSFALRFTSSLVFCC